MKTSIPRRLGINIAPAPVAPAPKPAAGLTAIPAAANPAAGGAPPPAIPSQGPGLLPTTQVNPLYDPTVALPAAPAAEEPAGWRGAIQRALIGFNKGASRVSVDPTYNPVAAGLITGAETIGAGQEDALNRRLLAQQAAAKPFSDAQAAALKTSYEEKARRPFKEAENQDAYNRTVEEQKAKLARETDLAVLEPLARRIASLAPSLRRVVLGKQAGPVAMALAARVEAIRREDPRMQAALAAERTATAGLTDSELEKRYQAELAGGKSEAGAAGTVRGGKGQEIGAVAASMEDMLTKAKPLMTQLDPSVFRTYNAAVQAGQREFNDPTLLAVDTYLNSAAGFYATLLKNGGVPDVAETDRAHKILTAKLNTEGFAAVEKALRDEGASRVKRIKEHQNPLAPGSATGAAPEAPAAPPNAGSTWRKY